MIEATTVKSAGEYVEWLRQVVHEKVLPANDYVRAAAPCFGVAQEHHHAIVRLIDSGLYASAFSLLRVAFEAYVRGEWLSLCASDLQRTEFLTDKRMPELGLMLTMLEETSQFSEGILSGIKKQSWDVMCSYTHTGGLQVQRWITAESIEPSYQEEEILELLNFAEILGSLAVLGTLSLASEENLADEVLIEFINRQIGKTTKEAHVTNLDFI